MSDDAIQAGELAPVQPGQGAFKETLVPEKAAPAVDTQAATLQEILAAVRGKEVPADKAAVPATEKEPAQAPEKVADAPAVVKPTGNKALDIAVQSFVKTAGATEGDISKALGQAYESGDVRLIDRAFLKERFGEHSDQAIQLAEAVMEYELEASQKLLTDVYSLSGGQEQFQKAVGIFKEHAPKGMQSVVKQMLDSNDADTVKEAASLIVEYGKTSGAMTQVDKRTIAGAGFAASAGISYEEFNKAFAQLKNTSRTYNQDMAALMEARRIGKQLGK